MKLPNNTSTTKSAEKFDNVEIEFSKKEIRPIRPNIIDFENEKVLKKYIKKVESLVRSSLEYRKFIRYLKEEQDYTSCAFFQKIDIKEIKKVGIEFHHYPFTLFDIVKIIIDKESHFGTQQISTFDIANEVMRLHYEGVVGLVPLSETLHELAHSGNIFINFKIVSGNVKKFMEDYNEYISPELLENIKILNDLSERNSEQSNNYILHTTLQNILMPDREIETVSKSKEEVDVAS